MQNAPFPPHSVGASCAHRGRTGRSQSDEKRINMWPGRHLRGQGRESHLDDGAHVAADLRVQTRLGWLGHVRA